MNVYISNMVEGLTSMVASGVVLAGGHWYTCECASARRSQLIDPARFLRGAR